MDNGYVYLAASRLSLYRSPRDWALVIEIFGFCPRAEMPDLHIYTFSNNLFERNASDKYNPAEAHENYLKNNPHNESRFFHPIDFGVWIDEEEPEFVNQNASVLTLRAKEVAIPAREAFEEQEIQLESDRIAIFELCRCLAGTHRNEVLATESERRTSVQPDMREILMVDEWNHPDVTSEEMPSQTLSFQQFAKVLETGDSSHYANPGPLNNHWKFWSDGGTL